MVKLSKIPLIPGSAFTEILQELHAHSFDGAPGESDPYVLSLLEREYVAYVLSLYYQCSHCQKFHKRAVERIRSKENTMPWSWNDELAKTVLFLRVSRSSISDTEWRLWKVSWKNFAQRVDKRHPGLACCIAYAVGIARADKDLMDLAFQSISLRYPNKDILTNVIKDIDRVTIFMKAATSKNRTDDIIHGQLESVKDN